MQRYQIQLISLFSSVEQTVAPLDSSTRIMSIPTFMILFQGINKVSLFANDFIKYLDGISDSLDEFFKLTDALRESENNKVKTLTWFEYESL